MLLLLLLLLRQAHLVQRLARERGVAQRLRRRDALPRVPSQHAAHQVGDVCGHAAPHHEGD
jgi:hypothetical protein